MLEAKYVYKFTSVARGPTRTKTSKYIGNPVSFEYEYHRDQLFELLYGDPFMVERIKIFKVTLDRSEWYWHADQAGINFPVFLDWRL